MPDTHPKAAPKMQLLFLTLSFIIPILGFAFLYYANASELHSKKLPPGSFGWPLIGETHHFLSQDPERFIKDRMKKYSSKIFKTHLLGEPMVVLCGTSGHKFIAANEGKLMTAWRPISTQRLFRGSYQKVSSSTIPRSYEVQISRSPMFKPEALAAYAEVMHSMTREHFNKHWVGKSEVEIYSLLKLLIVGITAKLFMGLENPERVSNIANGLDLMSQALQVFPLNIPGTTFARAKKASEATRNEILRVIKQKKASLAKGVKPRNMLSFMMTMNSDESGKFMAENEVADKIMGIMASAFFSPSVALTYFMKYLGENPHVYDTVRAEQLKIVSSKKDGEALTWDDFQKMKYSWNVLLEVMRLIPPLQGTFREVTSEFTYEGYTIPKGWKIYWTISTTNKDPRYFPEPEKFNPSRFENEVPPFLNIPFGGGPRVCPGKEYARQLMLIYIHHVITLFKWQLINFNPKVVGNMNSLHLDRIRVHLQSYAK